jgi:hypothetical protein
MTGFKYALILAAVSLGLALLLPDGAYAQDPKAKDCFGSCRQGTSPASPFPEKPGDFQPPERTSPPFKGHDYGSSAREFDRMSVRRGARPYSDLERSRAFSRSDPYEGGLYGRDDAAGRMMRLQDKQTHDPYGTGRPAN